MAINFTDDIVTPLYGVSIATDPAYQSPGEFDLPEHLGTRDLFGLVPEDNGTGYLIGDTITLVGGTWVVSAHELLVDSVGPPFSVHSTSTIDNGGAGYAENDTIDLVAEDPDETDESDVLAQITVTEIDGSGAVVAFTVSGGSYSMTGATLGQDSTSGGGTGFVLVPVWAGGVSNFHISNEGAYTLVPDNPVSSTSSGDGTGFTANAEWSGTSGIRVLTMIEILRSYVNEVTSVREAKILNDVLRRIVSQIKTGTTFVGDAASEHLQEEALRFMAGTNLPVAEFLDPIQTAEGLYSSVYMSPNTWMLNNGGLNSRFPATSQYGFLSFWYCVSGSPSKTIDMFTIYDPVSKKKYVQVQFNTSSGLTVRIDGTDVSLAAQSVTWNSTNTLKFAAIGIYPNTYIPWHHVQILWNTAFAPNRITVFYDGDPFPMSISAGGSLAFSTPYQNMKVSIGHQDATANSSFFGNLGFANLAEFFFDPIPTGTTNSGVNIVDTPTGATTVNKSSGLARYFNSAIYGVPVYGPAQLGPEGQAVLGRVPAIYLNGTYLTFMINHGGSSAFRVLGAILAQPQEVYADPWWVPVLRWIGTTLSKPPTVPTGLRSPHTIGIRGEYFDGKNYVHTVSLTGLPTTAYQACFSCWYNGSNNGHFLSTGSGETIYVYVFAGQTSPANPNYNNNAAEQTRHLNELIDLAHLNGYTVFASGTTACGGGSDDLYQSFQGNPKCQLRAHADGWTAQYLYGPCYSQSTFVANSCSISSPDPSPFTSWWLVIKTTTDNVVTGALDPFSGVWIPDPNQDQPKRNIDVYLLNGQLKIDLADNIPDQTPKTLKGTASVPTNDGHWHNVLIAWDTHATSVVAYLDGDSISVSKTSAGGSFDIPLGDSGGQSRSWVVGSGFTGSLAEVYFNTTAADYVASLANANVRARFVYNDASENAFAQNMAGNAGISFGYANLPEIYLTGPQDEFVKNAAKSTTAFNTNRFCVNMENGAPFSVANNPIVTAASDPLNPVNF